MPILGRTSMNKLTKEKFPTSLGVFSPTGHIVMAFATDSDAKKAQKALLDGGFKEEDVTHYNDDEFVSEFEKSEEQAISPLQIGQDVAKVEEFLALAKEGCGFLVVYAPKGERSKLAITIVHPYGLKFAEKYNWLTIEELA
jgi:hypothetical protein